jgi:hypothetical protein
LQAGSSLLNHANFLANAREGRKGKKHSNETRAKMSKVKNGKKHSAKHHANMRMGQKALCRDPVKISKLLYIESIESLKNHNHFP